MLGTSSWLLFALGSALFAGLTAIFGKIGVEGINSNFATFIRTIVILLVTALMVSLRQEWQKMSDISVKSLLFLVFSGIATGLSWLCYYRALQLGPASRVAPIDKLSVVVVIVISVLFLREGLTWQLICGGGLITVGSLILAWN